MTWAKPPNNINIASGHNRRKPVENAGEQLYRIITGWTAGLKSRETQDINSTFIHFFQLSGAEWDGTQATNNSLTSQRRHKLEVQPSERWDIEGQ